MKKITTLLAAAFVTTAASAQTSLPASWNFDDPQPLGWEESLAVNPGNTRYTNGLQDAACRLDADGEYVLVHFSDVCGGVTYNIKGQGNAANDVFTIQESVDGSAWTDMRVLEDTDLGAASNSFVEYTDVPDAASRYVRWFFTEKQSGRNVALDEITLIEQVPTLDQEIAITSSGQPVVNNSTFVIGTAASTPFTIENANLAGGSDLNITDVQITGVNAAEFSVSNLSAPAAVNAQSTLAFEVNFSTVETGTRLATLTITNDDANGDETSFVIELYGVGGDFATEPADQPTNLTFDDVTSYGYDVSFDDGTTVPENYLVLRSIGVPVPAADNPVDGNTYVKGDYINGSQVVYVGPAGEFRPSYVIADTDYHFAAYSFNGPAGFENYLTGAPATANITSSGSMVGNYYNGVDPNQASFLTDLQSTISQGYDQVFYSNYAPIIINKFASRDTTDGQKVITGAYSGFLYLYTGAFFYDVLSREHSWPHSWMPFFPDQDPDAYSDLHNLFPVHQNSANAVRSNRPLGEVVNQTSSFGDAQYGQNADGEAVYEPRDQHKGDAARAIFYMAVKWNGESGTWELPDPIDFIVQYGQDQDVLKQWHWQDPPDAWEIARNDFVESEQGNRNPFVDNPEWVCFIDFSNLTYIGAQTVPCTVTPNSIEEELEGDFAIVPNPTNGEFILNMNVTQREYLTIELMDVSGRVVSSINGEFNSGVTKQSFDFTNLDAGVYHLILTGENARTTLKVVLQ